MSNKTSFWEVIISKPEGEDSCYKRPIARFDRNQDASLFREIKAHAMPGHTFEIRMVQRARL